MRFGLTLGLSFAWLLAAPLRADPIVSQTGFLTGGFGVITEQTFTLSWTQASSYSDVAISATIGWPGGTFPIPPLSGTATLTNHVGPGTTAANEIASASFTAPSNGFTDQNLFLGLNLTGGTYYLILSANGDNNPFWADTSSSAGGSLTTGQGVSFNGFFFSGDGNADPALDTFISEPIDFLFSVSGTAVVPESSTNLAPFLATLTLLAVTIKRRGRRCVSRM